MSRAPFKRAFTLGNIIRNPADEVQTELAFHFDETVAELRAAGYSEQDAREEARRRFGDYATYRDELERLTRRRVTVSKLLERWSAIFKDLQYAARSLIRARGFTGSVVFTLAIGIGATSLMFSLVNGVILDPLPFPDSGRLVRVFDTQIERGRLSSTSSPANFVDWREQQSVFSDLAAYTNGRATFTDVQPAENLVTANVSAEWFQVLGVLPLLGRGFTRDEEVWGNHNVVVVSHAFWLNYLEADSAAVGRTIGLEGTAQTVVGVMPPGFAFPAQDVQLWRPLAFDFEVSTARGVHYLSVIARLAPGASLDRAQAGMDLLMVQLHDAYPEQLEGWGVRLEDLHESVVGGVQRRLWILFGAVGLVLLMAVVNVANLMLARATVRERELAVRVALGAGRARITRQLVTEGVMLAGVASVAGLLLASVTLQGVLTLARGIPRLDNVTIGAPVFGVAAGVAVGVGVVLGLLAAWSGPRFDVSQAVRDGGRHGSPKHQRVRNGFVVAQVSMAVMLVVGAVLLLRSFAALTNVNPGYARQSAWTATVSLPGSRYPAGSARVGFFSTLAENLEAIPGVEIAAATTQLPLEGYSINFSFMVAGDELPVSERPNGDFRIVTPGYFTALGIRTIRGRTFSATDTPESQGVVVINATLARQHFGDEDPIGRGLYISYRGSEAPREIVGVVADVRQRGLNVPPRSGYYLPIDQVTWSTMRLVVATTVDPITLTDAIRSTIAAIDPLLAVRDVRTLEQHFSRAVGSPRFNTFVLGMFAAIAILLAVSGIYSVMSYVVARRTREIGVKMALGAGVGQVRRSVSWEGIKLAALGVALGLIGAFAGGSVLSTLLYGVRPTDPLTFVLVSLAFAGVAWLGSYMPAVRASRVDPVIALRAD